jgi:hypothetical protein
MFAFIGIAVLSIGCGMDIRGAAREKYSSDDFNKCAPAMKMRTVCYFTFIITKVNPETAEAWGTVPRTLVKNNSERYGITDFNVNDYPLDVEHVFHVKPDNLKTLEDMVGKAVRFKSIPNSSTLELDRSPESDDDKPTAT